MDSDLIYAKTASGEEAMYQRTRVMQRNLRMILILVDGQSTVDDLCLKTGNRQLTESALKDLEKGGLIELRVEQDSIWAESKKVAQEIRAAAIDKALQFSRNKEPSRSSAPVSEPPISIHSVFNASPRSDSASSQFSLAPGARKRSSGFSQPQGPKTKPPAGDAEPPRPSFAERMKGIFSSSSEQADSKGASKPPKLPKVTKPAKVSIKPIRRGPRSSTGWPVITMYTIIVVSLLGFLTITFFPYDRYLPEVEAAVSQASGRPVKVGSMRVEVYPNPGLFLGDVRTGGSKDEIRITEIRLQPEISSLLEDRKVFREAVLSGITLSPDLVSSLPGVVAGMAKPDARVSVKHILLEKVSTSFGGYSLPVLEGEVRLSSAGLFQSLGLWFSDRTVNLELIPRAQNVEIVLDGIGWRPAQGSSVLIDSLSMKGSIDRDSLSISNLELHVFDGVIKMQGVAIQRADQMLGLSGDLSFERINATRLGEALGIGSQFAGETAGKMTFSTIAGSGTSMFSAMNADGDFVMRQGSVREIDLVETVRRASSAPVQGGSTSFEQLAGKIKLTPTTSMFSSLLLNSGLMQSTGYVEVSKDLDVHGQMELQMRGSVNQTRVPVSIGGVLKAPSLQLGTSSRSGKAKPGKG